MSTEKPASATIGQMARRLKLAPSTVSRSLKNDPRISEATRNRALQLAKELGYVPDRRVQNYFKSIRRGCKGVAFLLSPETYDEFQRGNTFVGRLQSALQAALRAADMHMLIANAATDLMADGSLYAVVEGMAEAIIGEVHDPDIVQRLAAHCPVVLLNSEVRCDNVDAVIPDLERALRRQIDFLVRVGHRRVACFRPRPSSRWGDRRLWQEYEDSSNRLGLAVPKEYLEPIQFGWDEHPHAINEFLERVIRPDIQPTAILTYDVYAGELIHQLAQRGLTVPKDISIVGFDDNTYGRFCPVPLTTFRQDFEEMAQTAVELLKRRLKEPSRAARVVEIAGQLVERKSTAPVGKTQADVDMGSTRQGKGNDL